MEVVLCPKAPPKTTITWSFLSSVQVQGSVDVDMYKYTYIRMYLLWYVYKLCNIYIYIHLYKMLQRPFISIYQDLWIILSFFNPDFFSWGVDFGGESPDLL